MSGKIPVKSLTEILKKIGENSYNFDTSIILYFFNIM